MNRLIWWRYKYGDIGVNPPLHALYVCKRFNNKSLVTDPIHRRIDYACTCTVYKHVQDLDNSFRGSLYVWFMAGILCCTQENDVLILIYV